jgi:16S rRNA (guanine966-N2)-methyltransferase
MRIIAGKFRGRPLRAPKGLSTRPTTSRAREALFSILADLQGKVVIDCYAGSGALGLEALSRGAREVVFIESDARAADTIRENLATFGCDNALVLECSVARAHTRLRPLAPIDWVLADPPWPIAQQALGEVEQATLGLLAADARLVVGHRASQPIELVPHSGLTLLQRRRWGDSAMSFFAARAG